LYWSDWLYMAGFVKNLNVNVSVKKSNCWQPKQISFLAALLVRKNDCTKPFHQKKDQNNLQTDFSRNKFGYTGILIRWRTLWPIAMNVSHAILQKKAMRHLRHLYVCQAIFVLLTSRHVAVLLGAVYWIWIFHQHFFNLPYVGCVDNMFYFRRAAFISSSCSICTVLAEFPCCGWPFLNRLP